ncbi:alpha/beta-hydrolase [Pseudovirgaria hyperparasitica]|uniref:Alpha/beta-hydrolase n=1 Tax=Pseudovirgaria hyperparasitica TaxID=470096 RepID=A0A6A6W0P0_9PEZI|nr:alpha/beta-hydrolase [Pseudovirgaria hyperparasitica]KAF2754641.1 alpha/beta-hydrolase [Pseudovirgaria hyperparasitica]
MRKPTIVFIHGAWHNYKCWNGVAEVLRADGIESVSLSLLSVGIRDTPLGSHIEDSQALHEKIKDIVEEGKDVIIVMHSYGGLAGSDAIEGLVKNGENGSTQGGVVAAIYVSAFIAPKGENLLGVFPSPPPYLKPNEENEAYLDIIDPHNTFYNDVSPEKSKTWTDAMKPHTAATFASNAQYSPWEEVPCTYVMCTKDQGVYPELQEQMFSAAQNGAKHPWSLIKLDSSHSAWLSRKNTLAGIIKDVVDNLTITQL